VSGPTGRLDDRVCAMKNGGAIGESRGGPPGRRDREARVRLSIGGMSCANCAFTVEKALKNVRGVKSAVVNVAAGAAAVRFDSDTTDMASLIEAVRGAGYRAVPGGSDDDDDRSLFRERLGLLGAALLALPILLIHHRFAPVPNGPFVLLLLGTVLQFTAGFRFYRGAWYSLRSGHANMDVLVALGITAAWAYSAVVVLFPASFPDGTTFFDMAALLILFIRFGKMLETGAKGRASGAMRALLETRPEKALLVAD